VGTTFTRLSLSYWIDNLDFITEEKLAAIFIKTFSWGFPTGRSFILHQLSPIKSSGTVARDNKEEEEAPTSTKRQQNHQMVDQRIWRKPHTISCGVPGFIYWPLGQLKFGTITIS
jgi:hypothetical protein